ncbi:thiamine-phosphate kinase [[Pseudomonas] carboxydohydrogena]|uniref:Thiamine-monophosphate kinase n=1 Tax=Afipia carboxydohydrogena TaxID=290 RepID=A0ABY8BWG5_AFICR|nr:thiamine-phosphate kinase [[Pseudomonas] carboxydohydrogena]WEF52980.1 thiamine-phosphate kinase [[Pseudomonas] carboxydohydrogena]
MASAEDDLIARYFRPLATHAGALGLIDDAAILAASGEDIVVTTDAIVEGVHFLPDDPPETLARKALRVNLSDLAAKGATPAGFVLTLALRDINEAWLAPFAQALGEDAAAFGCPLLGGDTVSTPGPLMISVTIFGKLPTGTMVRRDGAKPGDIIAVTGTIGDAALGLACLKGKKLLDDASACEALIARYRTPQPRNALAEAVRTHASAAMDISDGLAGDLAKLCAASKVSATVEASAIPLSDQARRILSSGTAGIEMLIAGGDDYEVLCTVPENRWAAFREAAGRVAVAVAGIGRVQKGNTAPVFLDVSGMPIAMKRLSYSHF